MGAAQQHQVTGQQPQEDKSAMMATRNMFRIPLSLFLCLGVFQAAFGFQQKEDPEMNQVDDYLRVVEEGKTAVPKSNTTATRLPLPLRLTPASVSIVPQGLNEEQNNAVLTDALRNVSGVNVMTNFGVHDFFTMRGLDSLTGGLVLTDSAPEPEASFYHLYNIERVEVLKGPGAYAYGGNPLSGTVNLIRKQPIFQNFLNLNTSFGSFDTGRATLDAGVANASNGLAFRVNGLWQESDGYRDDKQSEVTAFNPSVSWKMSETANLSLNVEVAENDYSPDSGIPFLGPDLVPVPRTTSYQSPSDFSNQDLLRIRLDYTNYLNDNLTLRNRFYHTDLDWQSNGTIFLAPQPTDQGTLDLLRGQSQLSDRQKFTGNQFEALLKLDAGSVNHHLLMGFEWVRNDDTFTLDNFALLPIDIFNPVEFAPGPLPIQISPSTAVDGTSDNLAIYALDRITFNDQFSLFLGGRFDRIDYDAVTDTGAGPTRAERDDSQFSPMFGFVYTPNENHSIYANGGGSFSPPSTLTLNSSEPEESQQVEVGTKHRFLGGRLSANFAIFQLERDNIGIPDQTGITQQTGDQRSKGFEFELAADLGQNWNLFTSYAFTDSELTEFREFDIFTQSVVDRSGNTSPFTPENLFNAWLSKKFSFGLGFGLGARYVDQQFISEDNSLEIADYVLVDAGIYYDARKWRASVNLRNLTDEDYENRGLRTPVVGSVIPGNPFEANGSIQLRF